MKLDRFALTWKSETQSHSTISFSYEHAITTDYNNITDTSMINTLTSASIIFSVNQDPATSG